MRAEPPSSRGYLCLSVSRILFSAGQISLAAPSSRLYVFVTLIGKSPHVFRGHIGQLSKSDWGLV